MKEYREGLMAVEAVISLKEITMRANESAIKDKQRVIVRRIDNHEKLKVSDIVLVKVEDRIEFNTLTAIVGKGKQKRFEVLNDFSKHMMVVPKNNVFAKVVKAL